MNTLSKKISQTYYTISALAGINKEDIFLVSYPKSGNTWVKFILLNILVEAGELENDYSFKTLDETIPEISRDNLMKKWKYKAIPRFIKSHIAYKEIFFKKNRTLLIIRDPRDVMVSYFHYALNTTGFNFDGDFSSFIRHKKYGLESCIRHQISWQHKASSIIKYEDLKKNGKEILITAIDKLGISLQKEILHQAFEKASFENMKKLEKTPKKYKNIHKKGYNFMRKGSGGQWSEYFTEDDINYYESLLEKHKDSYINFYEE
jgi:hypothetical protein